MNIEQIIDAPIEALKTIYETIKSLCDLYVEFCNIMPTPLNLIIGIIIPVIITILIVRIGSWFL